MTRQLLAAAGMACILATAIRAEMAIQTVRVGNPCNPPDTRWDDTGFGQVDYVYYIGKYEITAGQYTEFLNAVAATVDTYGLYHEYMANITDSPPGRSCNIQRSGSPGGYTYTVPPDWANRPVTDVSWGDAARFCNWLHNGQPTGMEDLTTTEDGSYFLNGATSNDQLLAIHREPDATWVIPSEDEWYKAAYHDNNCANRHYWTYPMRTDSAPRCVDDNGNLSGHGTPFVEGDIQPWRYATYDCDEGLESTRGIGPPYWRTLVGEWEASKSPYGTFDQSGNVWEWNEALVLEYFRGIRGGAYYSDVAGRAGTRWFDNPTRQFSGLGFRVVNLVGPAPEDVDQDGDVDLQDYARQQAAFTGPR